MAETDLPIEMHESLQSLNETVTELEQQFEAFLESFPESVSKLAPLERAELNVSVGYCLNALFFSFVSLLFSIHPFFLFSF